ncbi:MAG TPA: N-acetylglucosamine-6-phosphate deacetylase [Terriglobales bacterium]|jgi:N-acetylglucosamine-6-phosphate deacetylase
MLALTGKALLTPLERIEQPVVLIEGKSVVKVGSRTEAEIPAGATHIDYGDCVLAPGLVDIHIHGSAGHDVMQSDKQGLRRMEEFLAQRGITSYFPTTVAAPLDTTLRALEWMANTIESSQADSGRAQALGIHLEGPFLSYVRRGVHLPENLLQPSIATFEKFWEAARGHIRIMTIAPELTSASELIAEASKRGVCVSVGHSDADLATTRAAVAAGARHATHTFNAMRPLDHRAPGILGEVLSNPSVSADVIADGIHVHPTVVRFLLEAKGEQGAVLITDAMSAAGMPDGPYRLGGMDVEVKDGRVTRDGSLAGSVLTLDRAVRNVMEFAGWDLQKAVRIASFNPAQVSSAKGKGEIKAGADADLVALTENGEVRGTMVRGQMSEG